MARFHMLYLYFRLHDILYVIIPVDYISLAFLIDTTQMSKIKLVKKDTSWPQSINLFTQGWNSTDIDSLPNNKGTESMLNITGLLTYM